MNDMEKENVLEKGINALYQLREKLNTLNHCKIQLSEKDVEENRLENELELKNNMLQDEIQMAVVKRENEIVASFDEQIERQKNRMRKVQDKKDRSKNDKVSQRIERETAELRGDSERLKQDVKTIFQQGNLSRIFNTRLYFALFAPKGLGDFGIILITAAIVLIGSPFLLYYLIFGGDNTFGLILIYIATLVVVGGLYYLIYKSTKGKNPTAISSGRAVRYKLRQNSNKIQKIKKRILKDKDESAYNLGEYDSEIKDINNKIADINRQKAEAIATFRSSTSNILANDVRQKHEKEMEEAKERYQLVHRECSQLEDQIKELSMRISNDYEAYLGKEFMNLSSLEKLISIMQENQLTKVSEAMEYYKKQIGSYGVENQITE